MTDNPTGQKTIEELVMTQSYILEAMMNLLEKKTMISRAEIVQELKEMQANVMGKMKIEAPEKV